ncbi:MAG: hypothetical protein ACOY4R_29090 [Pseudomonadota bacterium]
MQPFEDVPLNKLTFSIRRAVPWLVAATIAGVIYVLLWWLFYHPFECVTTELGKFTNILGHDIEVSETDCWHDPLVSIRVTRPGDQRRIVVFRYAGGGTVMPTITTIDEHTIRISIPRVSFIDCRRDTFETLQIEFNIGSVTHATQERRC